MPDAWRNRFVRTALVPPEQLLANPKNWRVHPQHQQDALLGVLDAVGWVGEIKAQEGSDTVIDGHLRVALALRRQEPAVPVDYYDLTDPEMDLVLATHDPIAAMATADRAQLDALLRDVQTTDAALLDMLTTLAESSGVIDVAIGGIERDGHESTDSDESPYSQKIASPIYTPTGECPDVADLFDDARTRALVAEIEQAEGITDEERQFLAIAAQRHTVLHFGRIAEYYAHASADLQRLMENSALVIIDFERAIELGYVRLTQEFAEQVRDEYGS